MSLSHYLLRWKILNLAYGLHCFNKHNVNKLSWSYCQDSKAQRHHDVFLQVLVHFLTYWKVKAKLFLFTTVICFLAEHLLEIPERALLLKTGVLHKFATHEQGYRSYHRHQEVVHARLLRGVSIHDQNSVLDGLVINVKSWLLSDLYVKR